MRCQKCSTENSEKRKFCSECGALIAAYCRHCGFANSLTDKYCGGCGLNLSEIMMPDKHGASGSQTSEKPSGKYSADDINELFQEKSEKAVKEQKKKKSGEAEPVSQDFLDSIFDSDDSK